MKKITALAIAFLFLIPFASINGNELGRFNRDKEELNYMKANQNTSFYAETNSSWFVVKFACEQPITIEEMYVQSFSKHTEEREEHDFYMLIDSNEIIYDAVGGGACLNSYDDLFIHLNYSFINFDYEHLLSFNFSTTTGSRSHNLTLSSGTYYLICLHSHAKEMDIQICINVTGNVNFLATAEGNTTYLLNGTDFLGKANIYWCNGSIVRKGENTFAINHMLVGYFRIYGGIGVTRVKFIDPSHNVKNAIICDLGYRRHNSGWVHRRHTLGDEEICGYMIDKTDGEWAIKIDMLEFSGLRVETPPNIVFHYGDIKLP